MLLWRVHAPTQDGKKEQPERGEGRGSAEELTEAARERWLGCRWTRHAAQTGRTGELAFFIGDAFAAECASTMRTTRGGLAQRMKQAARVAQARGGFGGR